MEITQMIKEKLMSHGMANLNLSYSPINSYKINDKDSRGVYREIFFDGYIDQYNAFFDVRESDVDYTKYIDKKKDAEKNGYNYFCIPAVATIPEFVNEMGCEIAKIERMYNYDMPTYPDAKRFISSYLGERAGLINKFELNEVYASYLKYLENAYLSAAYEGNYHVFKYIFMHHIRESMTYDDVYFDKHKYCEVAYS